MPTRTRQVVVFALTASEYLRRRYDRQRFGEKGIERVLGPLIALAYNVNATFSSSERDVQQIRQSRSEA